MMSNHAWKLQDAKNRLSELVDKSLSEGPQIIMRRGKPMSVLISFEDFRKQKKTNQSFLKLCYRFVDQENDLEISRNQSIGRNVDLDDL